MGIAVFLSLFVPILLLYCGFLEITSRKSTKLTGSQMRLILTSVVFLTGILVISIGFHTKDQVESQINSLLGALMFLLSFLLSPLLIKLLMVLGFFIASPSIAARLTTSVYHLLHVL